jgi:hypothetical protein
LCRTRCQRFEATASPGDIIYHAAWPYHRFALSHRDVEELLAERGIPVSTRPIRLWCRKFGPLVAAELRRLRGAALQPVNAALRGRPSSCQRCVSPWPAGAQIRAPARTPPPFSCVHVQPAAPHVHDVHGNTSRWCLETPRPILIAGSQDQWRNPTSAHSATPRILASPGFHTPIVARPAMNFYHGPHTWGAASPKLTSRT